jgi:hypothetical protein
MVGNIICSFKTRTTVYIIKEIRNGKIESDMVVNIEKIKII